MNVTTATLFVSLAASATFAFTACDHNAPSARVATSASASAPVAKAPEFGAADVDALMHKAWSARAVTPAPRADDATYLRRVYIDIVGMPPPPDKVIAFTADTSPDKRAKPVDELLASPAYAEHWADYWEDELMGQARAGDIDRLALRIWLRDQFAKNVAWDQIVRALITASGQ